MRSTLTLSWPAARAASKAARAPPPVVQAPDPLEDRVVQRLDPQAETGDAGRAVGGELPARDALRVALHGDLRVALEREVAADGLEDAGQGVRLQERRRAAAEEDAADADAPGPRQRGQQRQLAVQGRQVPPHRGRVVQRARVEGAVVAAPRAERNVDVKAERRRGRRRRPQRVGGGRQGM
jgi:hypothetical protein